jgi:hypothetical protein
MQCAIPHQHDNSAFVEAGVMGLLHADASGKASRNGQVQQAASLKKRKAQRRG